MNFKSSATQNQIDDAMAGLRFLPTLIPGILRYEVGLDLGFGAENSDLALVADFAAEDDWQAYLKHPAHVEVIENQIAPIKDSVTRVQYLVE